MSDVIESWLREAAGKQADPGKVLDGLLKPGRSNLFTGEREGGKSHLAVGLTRLQIIRHPGSDPHDQPDLQPGGQHRGG